MFSGNHGKMNYTDSVRDLMIYVHNALKQMTGAGTQLKVGGEEQGRVGGSPLGPRLSPPGPLWEEVLKTHPGLGALLSLWLPGSGREAGHASLQI